MDIKFNDSEIVWPGRTTVKPVGFMIPTHLRVLTIEETPFVFVRKVNSSSECRSDEEPCPHFNTTETGESLGNGERGGKSKVVVETFEQTLQSTTAAEGTASISFNN